MPHYFGIDLGTTNSAIAYLDENGQPVVVPNTVTGHPTTPSVVYFQEPTEVAVGDVARNAAIAEPEIRDLAWSSAAWGRPGPSPFTTSTTPRRAFPR